MAGLSLVSAGISRAPRRHGRDSSPLGLPAATRARRTRARSCRPLVLGGMRTEHRSQPTAPNGGGIQGGGIALLGALAALGLALAVGAVVRIGFAYHTGTPSSSTPAYLDLTELGLWAGMVGASVAASRRNGTGSLVTDFGLAWAGWKDLWLGLTGGVLGRLAALAVGVGIGTGAAVGGVAALIGPGAVKLAGFSPHGAAGWVSIILLACVGAPVVEELFFRGLVQGALVRRWGTAVGVVATAAIFACAHLLDEGILAPLALFPAGLVFGELRRRTGKLAAGMVAHAAFNVGALVAVLAIVH